MTREQKIREARRLRTLGWTAPAIGKQLGVAESTIRNWYLGGDCLDCGNPITYDTVKYEPTKRCVECERARKTAQHGTVSKYKAGCGCDDCRRANRDTTRSLKGKPPPQHGYSGYKNYGCRCHICRDGKLVYDRSHDYEHQKAWAARKKGTEPPQHGTSQAYNSYACRCEICRTFMRHYARQRRARAAA